LAVNLKPPERGIMKYAKKTENVHVRVSPETKQLLEFIGANLKKSNTEVIEAALWLYSEQFPQTNTRRL
jgi:hypothetical protein